MMLMLLEKDIVLNLIKKKKTLIFENNVDKILHEKDNDHWTAKSDLKENVILKGE